MSDIQQPNKGQLDPRDNPIFKASAQNIGRMFDGTTNPITGETLDLQTLQDMEEHEVFYAGTLWRRADYQQVQQSIESGTLSFENFQNLVQMTTSFYGYGKYTPDSDQIESAYSIRAQRDPDRFLAEYLLDEVSISFPKRTNLLVILDEDVDQMRMFAPLLGLDDYEVEMRISNLKQNFTSLILPFENKKFTIRQIASFFSAPIMDLEDSERERVMERNRELQALDDMDEADGMDDSDDEITVETEVQFEDFDESAIERILVTIGIYSVIKNAVSRRTDKSQDFANHIKESISAHIKKILDESRGDIIEGQFREAE